MNFIKKYDRRQLVFLEKNVCVGKLFMDLVINVMAFHDKCFVYKFQNFKIFDFLRGWDYSIL